MPPRRRQSLHVIDDIRTRIAAGEFAPGDQLPTKRELMAHYKVTKHVIDEAIRDLNEMGVTEGIQGKGIFVPLPAESAPTPPPNHGSPAVRNAATSRWSR